MAHTGHPPPNARITYSIRYNPKGVMGEQLRRRPGQSSRPDPRAAQPQCRVRGSFATLTEAEGKFLDVGGEEMFGLLRHWGEGRLIGCRILNSEPDTFRRDRRR